MVPLHVAGLSVLRYTPLGSSVVKTRKFGASSVSPIIGLSDSLRARTMRYAVISKNFDTFVDQYVSELT